MKLSELERLVARLKAFSTKEDPEIVFYNDDLRNPKPLTMTNTEDWVGVYEVTTEGQGLALGDFGLPLTAFTSTMEQL